MGGEPNVESEWRGISLRLPPKAKTSTSIANPNNPGLKRADLCWRNGANIFISEFLENARLAGIVQAEDEETDLAGRRGL